MFCVSGMCVERSIAGKGVLLLWDEACGSTQRRQKQGLHGSIVL